MLTRLLISALLICNCHFGLLETFTDLSKAGECTARRDFPVIQPNLIANVISNLNSASKEPQNTDSLAKVPERSIPIGIREENIDDGTRDDSAAVCSIGITEDSSTETHEVHGENTVEADVTPTDSDPTLKLPPLDDAAVGGIEQHQIPTFNEFHAMLSENGDSKANKGAVLSDHDRVGMNVDSKQAPSSAHTNPTDSPVGMQPGSTHRSQPAHTAEDEETEPRIPVANTLLIDGHGGSSRSIPDATVPMESNVEPVIPPVNRPDDAKSHTSAPTTVTAPSDHVHATDHHMLSDRPVTLRRNVAAMACGAKLLDSSQAMKNAEAVLNGNNDEYMNVPCSADKWFVIEVCEPVQLRVIELASYELFSSRVKSFKVFMSDRYPAKSWDLVGQFVAHDVKGLQNFDVTSDKLIKFVKFEMLEHYGSEHYCPLTMIRLFGLVSDDLDDDDDDRVNDIETATSTTLTNTGTGTMQLPSPSNPVLFKSDREIDRPVERDEPRFKETSEQSAAQQGDSMSAADHSPTESYNSAIKMTAPVVLPRPRRLPRADLWPKRSSSESTLKIEPAKSTAPDVSLNVDSFAGSSSDSTSVPGTSHPTDSSFTGDDSNQSQTNILDSYPLDERESNLDSHMEPQSQPASLGSTQDKRTLDMPFHNEKVLDEISQLEVNVLPTPHLRHITAPSQTAAAIIAPLEPGASSEGVRGGFLKRMKEFFIGWLSSLVYSENDRGMQVNLSHTTLCSRHIAAIDSLMAYGLLNTSHVGTRHLSQQYVEDLFPQLSESKRVGLTQLQICLFYLDNLTRSILSSEVQSSADLISSSSSRASLHFAFNQHPTLWACRDASNRLHLVLNPSPASSDSSTFQYSILHLLVAFQYRERSRVQMRLRPFRINSFDIGEVTLFRALMIPSQTEPLWSAPLLNDMQWFFQCPKLPEFLLNDFRTAKVDDLPPDGKPDITTPVPQNVAINQSPPHSWIGPRGATREEIVVPAALAGSRKDTLLMRLNNRVRLLERNVSVSMRYLEELSQSYRRQMERLSRSFNLTTAWLKATAQGAEERDQLQQSRIDELELRLANLVSQLLPGRLLKSQSNDTAESGNSDKPDISSLPATASVSKAALPIEKPPPPPPPFPPSFDASLEWTPTYGQWPQIEDEWLDEDGVVETEDEDLSRPAYSLLQSGQTDGRISETTSRAQIPSSLGSPSAIDQTDSPSYGAVPYVRWQWTEGVPLYFTDIADWFDFLQNWITTQLTWASTNRWMPRVSVPNSYAIWMIYMALMHLLLAMCSHLLIYWTWLRPRSLKWQSNLLALPTSTVPTWSPIPIVGLEVKQTALPHDSEILRHSVIGGEVRGFRHDDQSFSHTPQHVVSCNHGAKQENRGSWNTVPFSKLVSMDPQVVPASFSAVASVEQKASVPMGVCTTFDPPVNRFQSPPRVVSYASQQHSSMESVMSVNVDTTPIENMLAKTVTSVASDRFAILSPPTSNRIAQTNCLQYAEFYNYCNVPTGLQPQTAASQSIPEKPKLSKSALRRRNRREKAQQKEQPSRACQQQ